MATTRRQRKHRSSGDLTVIELPDLLQSMGQSGRSGVLHVTSGNQSAWIYLKGGNVVGLTTRPGVLVQALRWLAIATPEQLVQAGFPNAAQMPDHQLGQALIDKKVVPQDGVRDAVDIHIEEGLTDILGWTGVGYELVAEVEGDAWGKFQMALGTSIPPGGLLMEGLRRQDELKRVADLLPARWDVLVREPGEVDQSTLTEGARAVLTAWREGRPAGAVLQLSNLAPWAGSVAVGALIEKGVFRLAEGQELIVFADHARSSGHYRTAEGLYRRAIERGAAVGRIHLALAELAERRGDEEQAASDYLSAAEGVADNNPADAVLAYRSAMRLGADRETCLRGLLQIYERLDEDEDACDALFELASFYEDAERIDESMGAVREALKHGADDVRCGQVLAALALMNDDAAEAVVHLEQVIRSADAQGRDSEAGAARRQLLLIEPGRCELALRHARSVHAAGQTDEALKILRRSLGAEDIQATEDILIKLREFLGELDSSDTANHEALVKAYAKREDRAGASTHLLALARNQERAGELAPLVDTLEQILELGGDIAEALTRYARALGKLGRDGKAVDAWRRAVVACLEAGELEQAKAWIEEAVGHYPGALVLRELQAVVANRGADRGGAERAYRSAAAIALGSGDHAKAQHLLQQAHTLCPEDIGIRLQLIELAHQAKASDLDQQMAEFVRFAVRGENLGLALVWSRRRAQAATPPAFGPRSELIELLRRMGRSQEELAAGRQLYSDLCEAGDDERALELLQRLVASHSKNPELVQQLAELHEALENKTDAVRFFRHSVVLYQQEDRLDEARASLDHLDELTPGDPECARAREYLKQSQAINWAAIRQERAAASKQRIADDASLSGQSGVQRRIIRHGTGSFQKAPTTS